MSEKINNSKQKIAHPKNLTVTKNPNFRFASLMHRPIDLIYYYTAYIAIMSTLELLKLPMKRILLAWGITAMSIYMIPDPMVEKLSPRFFL